MEMIPNIVKGSDMVGLVRYLFGEGRANEHRDQHIVASDPTMSSMGFGPGLVADSALAKTIANFLTASFMQLTPEDRAAKFRRVARRWNPTVQWVDEDGSPREGKNEVLLVTGQTISDEKYHKLESDWRKLREGLTGEVVGSDEETIGVKYEDVGVWHCSLSLHPDEPALDDETWNKITNDFMEAMDFGPGPRRKGCRWVAVRHGLSKNGGDHIHIAASMARENGAKWNDYNDFRRAQKACRELEEKYGLNVLVSAKQNATSKGDSAADVQEALKDYEEEFGKPFEYPSDAHSGDERPVTVNSPQTRRGKLETAIRCALLASTTEKEFLVELKSLGVMVKPIYRRGGMKHVDGWQVALTPKPGEDVKWIGGGRLASDLSLPRLRETVFEDSVDARIDALTEWAIGTQREKVGQYVKERQQARARAAQAGDEQALLEDVAQAANDMLAALDNAHTLEDLGEIAWHASGYFASVSIYMGRRGWKLANASRMMARTAQYRKAGAGRTQSIKRPAYPTFHKLARYKASPQIPYSAVSTLDILATALTNEIRLHQDTVATKRYIRECDAAIAALRQHSVGSPYPIVGAFTPDVYETGRLEGKPMPPQFTTIETLSGIDNLVVPESPEEVAVGADTGFERESGEEEKFVSETAASQTEYDDAHIELGGEMPNGEEDMSDDYPAWLEWYDPDEIDDVVEEGGDSAFVQARVAYLHTQNKQFWDWAATNQEAARLWLEDNMKDGPEWINMLEDKPGEYSEDWTSHFNRMGEGIWAANQSAAANESGAGQGAYMEAEDGYEWENGEEENVGKEEAWVETPEEVEPEAEETTLQRWDLLYPDMYGNDYGGPQR